jgi:hypothetical protein
MMPKEIDSKAVKSAMSVQVFHIAQGGSAARWLCGVAGVLTHGLGLFLGFLFTCQRDDLVLKTGKASKEPSETIRAGRAT